MGPVDLHAYPAEAGHKWWGQRIAELEQRCDRDGYTPELAVSEFGVSATKVAQVTSEEDTEEAQAVHYMRSALMDATVQNATDTMHWRYSLYFSHPYNSIAPELGMHSATDTARAVSKVAEILHSPASNRPGLGSEAFDVWIAAATDPDHTDDPDPLPGEETMRCGWLSSSGVKWGAIWRWWEQRIDFLDVSVESRDFVVSASEVDPGDATIHKFSGLDSYANVVFQASSTVSGVLVGDVTKYRVDTVDENPVFLRFEQ